MKKLSLLFSILLCCGLANAQIAVENFDYDAGTAFGRGLRRHRVDRRLDLRLA